MQALERENRELTKVEIVAFPIAFSLIVIFICLGINKNFFNSIQDGVNEYLPIFTQMGRIWTSGKFPFLTDNTLLGSNVIVELSHCVFTPQSILASLLAWYCEYKQIAAIFLAFFNMTLIGASCLVIGNLYRLRRAYSYLFSTFCIIQPEFLFLDARGCYNLAISQAWFVAAIATFLLLAQRVSLKNFLLNFLAVFFLLTTSMIFPAFAYGLFAIIFLLFHIKKPIRFPSMGIILLANFLALLLVLPLYSEYVYNSDLHNRFFSFNNWLNFAVFPWSSEILTFLPAYLDFVSLERYQFFVIPFAFSTIFVPIVFFNRNFFTFYRRDTELKFFICMILAYFLCSQMPARMGPLRDPSRFLPFFAFAICLATSFTLEYAERKKSSIHQYSIFVLICLMLSISKALGEGKIFIILQTVSAILLLFVYYVDKKILIRYIFILFLQFLSYLFLWGIQRFRKNIFNCQYNYLEK